MNLNFYCIQVHNSASLTVTGKRAPWADLRRNPALFVAMEQAVGHALGQSANKELSTLCVVNPDERDSLVSKNHQKDCGC